ANEISVEQAILLAPQRQRRGSTGAEIGIENREITGRNDAVEIGVAAQPRDAGWRTGAQIKAENTVVVGVHPAIEVAVAEVRVLADNRVRGNCFPIPFRAVKQGVIDKSENLAPITGGTGDAGILTEACEDERLHGGKVAAVDNQIIVRQIEQPGR